MAPEWLRRTQEGTMEVISRNGTTAQIDPLRFCQWLLARCRERGVQVRYPARALSVSRDGKGVLDGIRISQGGVETERITPLDFIMPQS
jgi:flavin-dependent dehydrogenase